MTGLREEQHALVLVDTIADAGVRELCLRLLKEVSGLHADVVVSADGVDIRAEVRGRSLCRIVPYRELFHVQVGASPMWESRVRDEAGYFEAVDMILRTFLRAMARAAPHQ